MRYSLFILIFTLLAFIPPSEPISDECKCKKIPLFGKVKFVESYPTFSIKFVDNYADIKVKYVENPIHCGEWQEVENYPDFTVKIVENYPDFTVKIVENYPGLN